MSTSETSPIYSKHTGTRAGRLIVALYGILTIAALARAAFQISTKLSEAPIAYFLSLTAGLIYAVATLSLAMSNGIWRKIAWVTVSIEMIGVIVVGTVSLLKPEFFPDTTVWSNFGAGYGYLPLLLPIIGLLWLWKNTTANESGK